ncbi:hypothetical protein AAMO2058_000133900 [Amorphochlora amoebiformis]
MSTAGNAASVSPPLPVTSHAKIPRAFSQSAKPWTFTLPNAATPVDYTRSTSASSLAPLALSLYARQQAPQAFPTSASMLQTSNPVIPSFYPVQAFSKHMSGTTTLSATPIRNVNFLTALPIATSNTVTMMSPTPASIIKAIVPNSANRILPSATIPPRAGGKKRQVPKLKVSQPKKKKKPHPGGSGSTKLKSSKKSKPPTIKPTVPPPPLPNELLPPAKRAELVSVGAKTWFFFDGEPALGGGARILQAVQSLWEIPALLHILSLIQRPLRMRPPAPRLLEHAILHPLAHPRFLTRLLTRLILPMDDRFRLKAEEELPVDSIEEILKLTIKLYLSLPSKPPPKPSKASMAAAAAAAAAKGAKGEEDPPTEPPEPLPVISLSKSTRELFKEFLASGNALFPTVGDEGISSAPPAPLPPGASSKEKASAKAAFKARRSRALMRARITHALAAAALEADDSFREIARKTPPTELRAPSLGKDSLGRLYFNFSKGMDCRVYRVGSGGSCEVVCGGNADDLEEFVKSATRGQRSGFRPADLAAALRKSGGSNSPGGGERCARELILNLEETLLAFRDSPSAQRAYKTRERKIRNSLRDAAEKIKPPTPTPQNQNLDTKEEKLGCSFKPSLNRVSSMSDVSIKSGSSTPKSRNTPSPHLDLFVRRSSRRLMNVNTSTNKNSGNSSSVSGSTTSMGGMAKKQVAEMRRKAQREAEIAEIAEEIKEELIEKLKRAEHLLVKKGP